jgi:hypothetical protein
LRSQKKRSLLFVNEHFSDKRNEEIGVFLLALNNKRAHTLAGVYGFIVHFMVSESSALSIISFRQKDIRTTIDQRRRNERIQFILSLIEICLSISFAGYVKAVIFENIELF